MLVFMLLNFISLSQCLYLTYYFFPFVFNIWKLNSALVSIIFLALMLWTFHSYDPLLSLQKSIPPRLHSRSRYSQLQLILIKQIHAQNKNFLRFWSRSKDNISKNSKGGPGRALVKHHNHLVTEAKKQGYGRTKHVLESITDVKDVEVIIEEAEEVGDLFSAHMDGLIDCINWALGSKL